LLVTKICVIPCFKNVMNLLLYELELFTVGKGVTSWH